MWWRVLLLSVLVGIASCSGPSGTVMRDGAPVKKINAADVPNAVPRADPILAAGNKSPYTVNGVSYDILENPRDYHERGLASWYGTKFHGRKTSNGEIYDLYEATAAHKTLPIPCYVQVTNLDNNRSIVVRVNDRGPFHADRIIDLSYGAAVKLGYMEKGTARVDVRILNIAGVDDRRLTDVGHYRYLQLGAFSAESSALKLRDEVGALLQSAVFVSPVQSGDSMMYRVRVGPLSDKSELTRAQRKLREYGYDAGQPLP